MRRAFNEIERARSALWSLDAGCDRETWVRIAMAARDAGLDFGDFLGWCSTGANFKGEADCRSVWNSFKGEGVTATSLFRAALAAGWRGDGEPSAARPDSRQKERPPPEAPKPPPYDPVTLWNECAAAEASQPYVVRKQGLPDGLRVYRGPLSIAKTPCDNALVLPIFTLGGVLVDLQFIPPAGEKRFLPGIKLSETPDACFIVGGSIQAGQVYYVLEGVGQAWSAHRATGAPAVVCFGAGRVAGVVAALCVQTPTARPVIVLDAAKENQAEVIARKHAAGWVEMPAGSPNNFDLNDLHRDCGLPAVAALLAQVKTTTQEEPAWKLPGPIGTLEWATARHAPDCIVEKLIYADVRLLIAPGGSGKTTLMLHESICIVLGLPLWGREVRRPGPVVILTSEDSREMLTARLRSMAEDMALTDEQAAIVRECVRIADVSGEGFKLTEVVGDVVLPSARIDNLIAGLRDIKPSLIVIDPAVSFGVGEARVNDAEQGLIESARRLRNGLNCAVQYIHHSGKANARAGAIDQYAGRGGSAFADGSRMVCVLAPIASDEWFGETGQELADDENAIRLALPKLSYCPPQPDILIRRTGYSFEYVRKKESGRESLRDANADMVHRLLVSELAEGRRHSKNSLEDATDLKRADLRKAVDWLVACGRVETRSYKREGNRGGNQYLHPVKRGDAPEDGDAPEKDDLGSPSDSGEANVGNAL